jgi:hypothetical protein
LTLSEHAAVFAAMPYDVFISYSSLERRRLTQRARRWRAMEFAAESRRAM